jgi:hypothetical protein
MQPGIGLGDTTTFNCRRPGGATLRENLRASCSLTMANREAASG